MPKLILVRHGHVEGITPERFRGRTELPLTALGRAQAAAVAARIAARWRPDIIRSSPMGRCVETARAIAAACGGESDILPALNDIDYGAWQGLACDLVKSAEPAHFALWHESPVLMRFPGGESLEDLAARAGDVLRFAIGCGEGATVVLVGHDSINRALLALLLDQPLSAYWRLTQSPAAISEIDLTPTRIRVLRINETAHLETLD